MKIRVSSDSTCDLSPELVQQYDIQIIPLYIIKGGQPYKDTLEICPQDIFDWFDAGNGVCSTSAVNEADYIDAFQSLRRDCDALIHFTISSEMSACYTNACLAAEDPSFRVVHTKDLTHRGDNLHFNTESLHELGRRYFEAYREFLKTEK